MSKKNEIQGLVIGLVAVIAVACFFLLGSTIVKWEFAWMVFLAVPVTAIIMDFVTKNKDISGSIVGIVAILAMIAFFILGFSFQLWHPGWLVFLAIPIAAILVDIIRKKEGISGSIVGFVAILTTAAFILMGNYIANSWRIAWVVFLAVPITAIIVNIVKTSKKKDDEEKKVEEERKG